VAFLRGKELGLLKLQAWEVPKNLTGEYLLMWRFPKMGDPQVTIGFNTEIVLFWMIWGYHHFRNPPCITIRTVCYRKWPHFEIIDLPSYKMVGIAMLVYQRVCMGQGYERILCHGIHNT
jgi:hypothetical protein